jgi:putative aldouronate transport system substrate-binding protein
MSVLRLGAYGVHPQKWVVENGQVVYGAVAEGYREFLKTMAAWYAEGIIDPEFLTDQNATYASKVANGRLGAYDGHPTYFDLNNKTLPPSIATEKVPTARFVFLEPPVGPGGKSGAVSYGLVPDWGMMFGSKTSDETMIRAMEIGEAINTDIDLFRLINAGDETTWNAIGEQRVVKPGIVPAEYGINLYRTTMVHTWDRVRVLLSEAAISLIEPTVAHPLLTDVVNPNKVNAATDATANRTELDRLASEYYFNAIAGRIDIDATWADYVKRYDALGNAERTRVARTLPRYY